jgi:16S rRNA (guanine527-N7)-methyltransferase
VSLQADLDRGLQALKLTLSAGQAAKLLDYLALLEKWNRVYNLTAIREPERMLTQHLLDSLAVVPRLPQGEGRRVLDVGSGGGLPGIPLAIARPDWRITLLDSNHKKASFLRQAVAELGLANAEAVQARVEELQPAQCYDVVISRAFSELADFAVAGMRLLCPEGVLAAMKGLYPDEEIARLPAELASGLSSCKLEVPGLDAARHLIFLKPKP